MLGIFDPSNENDEDISDILQYLLPFLSTLAYHFKENHEKSPKTENIVNLRKTACFTVIQVQNYSTWPILSFSEHFYCKIKFSTP